MFEGRPVGNSPEFMPLDMLLNNDTKLLYDIHYALTARPPDNGVQKFSLKTTKLIHRLI